MAIHEIPGHGLRIDGHEGSREATVTQARAWLVENGFMDEWDAEGAITTGTVVRAWWNDERGFVTQEHPGAVPVTVVNIPNLGKG